MLHSCVKLEFIAFVSCYVPCLVSQSLFCAWISLKHLSDGGYCIIPHAQAFAYLTRILGIFM